ncbi:MAG: class I SAM-dependent methyltransferase, partial [Burkholderiales bacterium]
MASISPRSHSGPACRVLDVACGEGYGTALLAGQGNQVWGVDLSPAAVAHARQAYGGQ